MSIASKDSFLEEWASYNSRKQYELLPLSKARTVLGMFHKKDENLVYFITSHEIYIYDTLLQKYCDSIPFIDEIFDYIIGENDKELILLCNDNMIIKFDSHGSHTRLHDCTEQPSHLAIINYSNESIYTVENGNTCIYEINCNGKNLLYSYSNQVIMFLENVNKTIAIIMVYDYNYGFILEFWDTLNHYLKNRIILKSELNDLNFSYAVDGIHCIIVTVSFTWIINISSHEIITLNNIGLHGKNILFHCKHRQRNKLNHNFDLFTDKGTQLTCKLEIPKHNKDLKWDTLAINMMGWNEYSEHDTARFICKLSKKLYAIVTFLGIKIWVRRKQKGKCESKFDLQIKELTYLDAFPISHILKLDSMLLCGVVNENLGFVEKKQTKLSTSSYDISQLPLNLTDEITKFWITRENKLRYRNFNQLFETAYGDSTCSSNPKCITNISENSLIDCWGNIFKDILLPSLIYYRSIKLHDSTNIELEIFSDGLIYSRLIDNSGNKYKSFQFNIGFVINENVNIVAAATVHSKKQNFELVISTDNILRHYNEEGFCIDSDVVDVDDNITDITLNYVDDQRFIVISCLKKIMFYKNCFKNVAFSIYTDLTNNKISAASQCPFIISYNFKKRDLVIIRLVDATYTIITLPQKPIYISPDEINEEYATFIILDERKTLRVLKLKTHEYVTKLASRLELYPNITPLCCNDLNSESDIALILYYNTKRNVTASLYNFRKMRFVQNLICSEQKCTNLVFKPLWGNSEEDESCIIYKQYFLITMMENKKPILLLLKVNEESSIQIKQREVLDFYVSCITIKDVDGNNTLVCQGDGLTMFKITIDKSIVKLTPHIMEHTGVPFTIGTSVIENNIVSIDPLGNIAYCLMGDKPEFERSSVNCKLDKSAYVVEVTNRYIHNLCDEKSDFTRSKLLTSKEFPIKFFLKGIFYTIILDSESNIHIYSFPLVYPKFIYKDVLESSQQKIIHSPNKIMRVIPISIACKSPNLVNNHASPFMFSSNCKIDLILLGKNSSISTVCIH